MRKAATVFVIAATALVIVGFAVRAPQNASAASHTLESAIVTPAMVQATIDVQALPIVDVNDID
jgi:hypothetical protein